MSVDGHEDDIRKELRELQQFVLNRRTNNIRNELYEYMVLKVLFDHTKIGEYMSLDGIKHAIESDFNLKQIPLLHLQGAVDRLVSNHSLRLSQDMITLVQTKRKEFESKDTSYSELRIKVHKQLEERLKKKLPSLGVDQIHAITQNFYRLLGSSFARYGILSARILGGRDGDVKKLKDYAGFQTLYQDLIHGCVGKQYHKALDEEFSDFFFNPSPELCKFFYAMAQSYVLIEILNVDPELRRMERSAWSRKRVYVDTNLLLALLLKGHNSHESVERLISYTRELSTKMFVNKLTKKEFDTVRRQSKQQNKKVFANGGSAGEAVLANRDVKKSDPFIATYAIEAKEDAGQTYDGFYLKYENFMEILKNKYGIEYDGYIHPNVEKHGDLERMTQSVLQVTPFKSDNVVFHDTYNILAVREMRSFENSDGFGPDTWFLTNDSSLSEVELLMYGDDTIPASISTDAWLQVISPFLSPEAASEDAASAFTKLLGSNLVSTYVNPRDISDFMSLFMDDKDFTVDQFKRIIGDKYIRDSLSAARGAVERGEESKVAEIVRPLLNKVKEEVTSDYESRISSIKEEHTQAMQEESTKYEDKIGALRREQDEKIEIVTEDLAKVKSELGETKAQERKKAWKVTLLKIIVVTVICMGIIDGLVFYLYFDTYGPALFTIIAVEAGIIFGLPKLVQFFKHDESEAAD